MNTLLTKAVITAAVHVADTVASSPTARNAINKASLKLLNKASEAGNPVAKHILRSIENGSLFKFISGFSEMGAHLFSTPPLDGRDADKQPITHRPVLQCEPGDNGLNVNKIFMEQDDHTLKPWDPSANSETRPSPSEQNPQARPESSTLPVRPPLGGLGGFAAAMLYNVFKAHAAKHSTETPSASRPSETPDQPQTNYKKPTVTDAAEEAPEQSPEQEHASPTQPLRQEGAPERPKEELDKEQLPKHPKPAEETVPMRHSGPKSQQHELTIDSVLKKTRDGQNELFLNTVKQMGKNGKGFSY